MPDISQLFEAIEYHSPEKIQAYFAAGGSPNDTHNGIPVFTAMVEMYTRSPRFNNCVNVFIEHGLAFDEPALLAVFTDDAERLRELIRQDHGLVFKTYSLFRNTYSPLTGGSLLHFCAEYNSVDCATVLVAHGADVNATAGIDEYGFGGHTPIFHTVNQNSNNSARMLHFLLEHGADLLVTVKGLVWGKGYEWETFFPAVNPISYAMMGLLPQVHRKELIIAETVSLLIKKAYGIDYTPANIPNAYLQH